jgi:anion-transporting  ArsA/GET3 family ATPase
MNSPVISTPEASTESMLGPDQQGILEEFIAEQQAEAAAEQQQRILGKFNSTEDLVKAYQELEKKLGQQGSKAADPSDPTQPNGYTPDQAAQVYGKEAVEALSEQGVDLADLMWKADQGEDISDHYDTLAATFKVPRQVVENYVTKAQVPKAQPQQQGSLNEADVAELTELVGGQESFQKLSQWATTNLSPQELASYNAAVDSGNKEATRWALLAMQARAAAPQAGEPKLISGGKPPAISRFESKQQVLDAMNRTNDRGQRLYDVDEAYRQKVTALLANSDVF